MEMESGVEYVAPRNELEKQIVEIWEKLLNKDRIGLHDGFFELGGDSIKIVKLAKLLSNLLNMEITVVTLFQYSNIIDFINYIKQDNIAQLEEELDREELIEDLNKFDID